MTAEIAILNKSAVALATDSAVTITSGGSHKVYDSADKLFELSCNQPLGIMIYNGMQYAGIPLPELIKEFRSSAPIFQTVDEAAEHFLAFLDRHGATSPASVRREVIERIAVPVLDKIEARILDLLMQAAEARPEAAGEDFRTTIADVRKQAVDEMLQRTAQLGPGQFSGEGDVVISAEEGDWIDEIISQKFPGDELSLQASLRTICEAILRSSLLSDSLTGLVVAGFGETERFPTLVSYEVDGPIFGRLKFQQTSRCDIDRDGDRAFIRPFAQREMVERFLYGLDEYIQREIHEFCAGTVGSVSDEVLSSLIFDDDAAKDDLAARIRAAEGKFLQNLREKAFKVIEERSRRSVEDMIQFMPKPELSRMAEALVELTSMKRKVTAGVETVGGPVDVAVISKAEGFVWVKRKHYFPPELNARYFDRVKNGRTKLEDQNDA